ncbi:MULTISPECIES: hypothetical protein [Pseudomonas]|uniref:Lipoprotein n=1 Tax=Pseudomonas fluorescens TaxID=294 RepID=A0A161ZAB3_PSEFL|nr:MULTISPECIES: hypothetical protein [Pseudomonas]KZN20647.1 hypothetical protein A1D17_03655 [Pseudomonas fluorescens]
MKKKNNHVALLAGFVVLMTGCASSPEHDDSSLQAQKRVLAEAKKAPQRPVELTIGSCNGQRDLAPRKMVVPMGKSALFGATEASPYELTARAIKSNSGEMYVWFGALWLPNGMYTRFLLTKDGEASPPITPNGDDSESCFTVTANSQPGTPSLK